MRTYTLKNPEEPKPQRNPKNPQEPKVERNPWLVDGKETQWWVDTNGLLMGER